MNILQDMTRVQKKHESGPMVVGWLDKVGGF